MQEWMFDLKFGRETCQAHEKIIGCMVLYVRERTKHRKWKFSAEQETFCFGKDILLSSSPVQHSLKRETCINLHFRFCRLKAVTKRDLCDNDALNTDTIKKRLPHLHPKLVATERTTMFQPL